MLSKLEKLPQSLEKFSERNLGTVWQVVKAYQANLRQGTVGTKTRAAVASTGKKPFKQKKTGSARRGSFVSPLHVGGGVAHGPQMRDHTQNVTPGMAKVALGISLAQQIKAGSVFLGEISFPSGKTKDAFTFMKEALPGVGRVTVCLDVIDESTYRALRNLRGIELISPAQVNALSLVRSRCFISTPKAIEMIVKRLEA